MIYIWVRTAIDWENERAFLAQVHPQFRSKVDVWNKTFNMPFHVFRHEIRQIARLNLSRVEDSVRCSWDEIPEGGLVLPVDDDDWFAPTVATSLEIHYHPAAAGYYWISSFIEVPMNFLHELGLIRRRLLPRTPPRWICTTNNYAVVKASGTEAVAANHLRASEWFGSQQAGRVRRLDQRLSVMNRTPASQTSLGHRRPQVTRSELIRKYHRYRKLYRRKLDGAIDLAELAWCRPYVTMMRDLMDRLTVRQPDVDE